MTAPTLAPPALAELAAEVRAGLDRSGQKELPSKYLYDAVGSALFQVITLLPEYGLARAGMRLLKRNARELAERLSIPARVVELGCGSARKARHLLIEIGRLQGSVAYCAIDVSPAALERCREELSGLPEVSFVPFEGTYLDGIREAVGGRRDGEHVLVLFLGGTIGNFDRPAGVEFLGKVRAELDDGDCLLLAADLEKPVPGLLAAYNDPIGVTSAFNLNLLARLNRELGADFDLERFEHVALYNAGERRIEMHLRSTVDQTVTIPGAGLGIRFRRDETIWTESSHRFTPEEIADMGRRAGFACEAQWVDRRWPFAHSLLVAD